jgi:hypothetical protein
MYGLSEFRDYAGRSPNRRFQFHKRRQLFIRVHNETLSVVAVRSRVRHDVRHLSRRIVSLGMCDMRQAQFQLSVTPWAHRCLRKRPSGFSAR